MALTRSDNRMIAGVASGLAESFNLDPTVVRIGFALLAILGGSGVPIYLALWLIMPDRRGESGLKRVSGEFSSRKGPRSGEGERFDPYKE